MIMMMKNKTLLSPNNADFGQPIRTFWRDSLIHKMVVPFRNNHASKLTPWIGEDNITCYSSNLCQLLKISLPFIF